MEMREAQPYRVPFTTFRGVVEHRDLQFAGHSPPRRLVCARCRVVSTTELRYESASRAGDFACGACARINVNQRCGQPPRLDRGDSAELEERPEGDWKEPQKPSDRDVELLNDCEVLCVNACFGCDVRVKLSGLSNHLLHECTRNVIMCHFCGQRFICMYLWMHACPGRTATSPPDASEYPVLVWAPAFNCSRESVVADCKKGSVAGTNIVPPALNGAGPSVTEVPAASVNHRNGPGRARRTLEEAPVPYGHLPQGSPTPLAGTLLVRFPDCAPERPAGSTVSLEQSSRVEFFGSDQLVVDGFRLVISAMVFYDSAKNVSGPAFSTTSPAALKKFVVFELLARDVDDSKGKCDRRRRWPPAGSVALTLNGPCGEDDRLLRTRYFPVYARGLESGRWTRVATTEAVDAEVVSKDFLAFGVVGVTVEFQ
ncbi:uncharacterized protein LOC119372173 [Rhipicephalus sanguineus]|uniref:uncharacterized protein LOC119372173 n=1 Tax=Rhipicephalus sanguineus TaxID=34632 RepID=UPI0018959B56|nr:uncharacterized protein LOC119372173 [Rhipicephalus sanguineus]